MLGNAVQLVYGTITSNYWNFLYIKKKLGNWKTARVRASNRTIKTTTNDDIKVEMHAFCTFLAKNPYGPYLTSHPKRGEVGFA